MCKKLLMVFCIIAGYASSCTAALPVQLSKREIADGAVSARLDAMERSLDILQKYVYNLKASQLSGASHSGSMDSSTTEEIGIQFKSIRGDIESIQKELIQLNEKISKIHAQIDNRIVGLESPAKEKKENAKIIDKVESELREVHTNRRDSNLASGTENDVEKQFKKAFYLLKSKNLNEAKEAFEKFISDNPSETLVGAAHYWIGEIYFQNQEYDKAAVEYLKGYQSGSNSGRARENLLKLADSLLRIGKRKESCAAINKLNKEFSDISASIKREATRIAEEGLCEE